MSTEPKAMREIHEIREQIYEEIKHMTPKEQTEYFHREAEEAIKKYGLTRHDPSIMDPRLEGAVNPAAFRRGRIIGDIISPFHEEWGESK